MILISPITQMVALNGIALFMEAGIEQPVRKSLVEAALAQGCVKVGERVRAGSKPAPTEPTETPCPLADPIVKAIETLVTAGKPKNFGVDGSPKVRSVEKILGYDISATDRDVAWATFQEA